MWGGRGAQKRNFLISFPAALPAIGANNFLKQTGNLKPSKKKNYSLRGNGGTGGDFAAPAWGTLGGHKPGGGREGPVKNQHWGSSGPRIFPRKWRQKSRHRKKTQQKTGPGCFSRSPVDGGGIFGGATLLLKKSPFFPRRGHKRAIRETSAQKIPIECFLRHRALLGGMFSRFFRRLCPS